MKILAYTFSTFPAVETNDMMIHVEGLGFNLHNKDASAPNEVHGYVESHKSNEDGSGAIAILFYEADDLPIASAGVHTEGVPLGLCPIDDATVIAGCDDYFITTLGGSRYQGNAGDGFLVLPYNTPINT